MSALASRIPPIRRLEIYMSGFALTLTAGKAGETVRSVYRHPYAVSHPEIIGVFISDRLLDLVAVVLLACLAVFIFPVHRLRTYGAASSTFAVVVVFRSRLIALMTTRLAKSRVSSQTSNGISAVQFLLSESRLPGALSVSLLAWTAQGFSLYLIVNSLGYDHSATTVIAIYFLSILAGAA